MVSKTLVTIALAGVIGTGFFAGGTLLRKANNSRAESNLRFQEMQTIFDQLSDMDHNGQVDHEEMAKVYCMIKGHYKSGKDPKLTFEEKEKWIFSHGYYWNEPNKKYEHAEPPKPQPNYQGTPKDNKCPQNYSKKK
jgi:hypothetical protein